MTVNARYNSWYISVPSSAKHQREMTKFKFSLRCLENVNHDGKFLNFVQMAADYKFHFRSPSLHGPSIIHRRFEFAL